MTKNPTNTFVVEVASTVLAVKMLIYASYKLSAQTGE